MKKRNFYIFGLALTLLLTTGCAKENAVPPVLTKPEVSDEAQPAEPIPTQIPEETPPEEPEPKTPAERYAKEHPGFATHSIDDPNSIWVVSNKLRPLNPENYEPADLFYPEGVVNTNGQPLREVAAIAAEDIILAAQNAGVSMGIISAYRPYDMQVYLYNSYIERDGIAAADRYSARPGHSEHQTGLVIDFDDFSGCGLMQCFEDTAAGIWLKENAHAYGFIMRYPDGFEHITGFMYEPWHFRYVGPELAEAMRLSGVQTLEEWFGLQAAPDYNYDW